MYSSKDSFENTIPVECFSRSLTEIHLEILVGIPLENFCSYFGHFFSRNSEVSQELFQNFVFEPLQQFYQAFFPKFLHELFFGISPQNFQEILIIPAEGSRASFGEIMKKKSADNFGNLLRVFFNNSEKLCTNSCRHFLEIPPNISPEISPGLSSEISSLIFPWNNF